MNSIAAIGGSDVLKAILWVITAGVVFWIFDWFIRYVGVPEPFAKIARLLAAILAVLMALNALFSFQGHPLLTW